MMLPHEEDMYEEIDEEEYMDEVECVDGDCDYCRQYYAQQQQHHEPSDGLQYSNCEPPKIEDNTGAQGYYKV